MLKELSSVFKDSKGKYLRAKGIISNTGWLILDKGIRMAMGLLVGAWVARYLGPVNYGTWSYATAFVLIFSALSTLGADGIIVRNIINEPGNTNKILGSSLALKFLSGAVTWLLSFAAISLLKGTDTSMVLLVSVLSAAFLVQSIDVIDFYFQSILAARYTISARIIALLVANGLRVIAIVSSMSLIYFGFIQLIELLLGAILLVVIYQYKRQDIRKWQIDFTYAKGLLISSYGMLVDGLLVAVSMQIDRLLIEFFHNEYEVGIYATAVNLSQLWYFIPVFLGASMVPTMVTSLADKEKYDRVLKTIFTIMTISSILIGFGITLFSNEIIMLLYGESYSEAVPILCLHVWTCVFVFHVSIRSRSLVVEDRAKYVGLFSLTMTVLSLGFNLILIPEYGGMGAAISSLAAWLTSVMLLPLFSAKTRKYVRYFFHSLSFRFW